MAFVKKKAAADRGVRSPVTPFEINGSVTLPGGSESKVVLIWNVSDQGLCLWLSDRLRNGELVDLKISRPWELTMQAEVRWCKSVPDRSGYLVGLQALDHLEELAEIHQAIVGASDRAS